MDPDISRRAYALLRKARNITYRWICEVQEKLDSVGDEASRVGLHRRLCKLAMTCFSTFDVGSEHVASVIVSEEDFSIAMQCAVIVHGNTPSPSDDKPPYLSQLLNRHRRLLHNLEPIFGQSLLPVPDRAPSRLLHSGAYDDALARLQPGYHQGKSPNWHSLPRPNSRWISCVTGEGQEVYYDLLSGELIISGRRLGGLPKRIIKHHTYVSVFGTVSVERRLFPALWDLTEVLSENS